MMCAASTDSIFSWTARECLQRWLPKETTSISRISENTATRFTSAARKTVFLFGEAVVITNDDLKPHFRNMIKQRGGMFAKGFLFGVQFCAYFKDGLWLDLARHAVTQAQRIAKAAEEKGYTLYAKSPTNQVFIVLSHEKNRRV